jgi:hypothetical protein
MPERIRITTQTTERRVYEIDVEKLLADPYFGDVDLTSVEALGDRFEDWLSVDCPEDWTASWATELRHLNDTDREVYEVELDPPSGERTGP